MHETKQGRFNEVIQLSSYGEKGDVALFETNPKGVTKLSPISRSITKEQRVCLP